MDSLEDLAGPVAGVEPDEEGLAACPLDEDGQRGLVPGADDWIAFPVARLDPGSDGGGPGYDRLERSQQGCVFLPVLPRVAREPGRWRDGRNLQMPAASPPPPLSRTTR